MAWGSGKLDAGGEVSVESDMWLGKWFTSFYTETNILRLDSLLNDPTFCYRFNAYGRIAAGS